MGTPCPHKDVLVGGSTPSWVISLLYLTLPPGFTGMKLLAVDRDGTVHILHFFISVPVGVYLNAWRLFACLGNLPLDASHRWWRS